MIKEQIQGCRKLIKDIDSKIAKWNERSNFTLKGVKNLSMSDMEDLKYYSEHFIKHEGFRGLMTPRGAMEQVFIKYGVI